MSSYIVVNGESRPAVDETGRQEVCLGRDAVFPCFPPRHRPIVLKVWSTQLGHLPYNRMTATTPTEDTLDVVFIAGQRPSPR